MNKNTKLWLGAGALLAGVFILNSCNRNYAPLQTVESVDLNKYEGRWYEIAALPQRFEKGCHCVYAEYKINPDGYVEVHNVCRKGGPNGKLKEVQGKGFPVEGSNNSKLRVQFFWPFRGDYWILALDEAYNHVLVGSPDRESLWILSRAPQLNPETYDRLLQLAKEKGFPVENMEKMDQSCYTGK